MESTSQQKAIEYRGFHSHSHLHHTFITSLRHVKHSRFSYIITKNGNHLLGQISNPIDFARHNEPLFFFAVHILRLSCVNLNCWQFHLSNQFRESLSWRIFPTFCTQRKYLLSLNCIRMPHAPFGCKVHFDSQKLVPQSAETVREMKFNFSGT